MQRKAVRPISHLCSKYREKNVFLILIDGAWIWYRFCVFQYGNALAYIENTATLGVHFRYSDLTGQYLY